MKTLNEFVSSARLEILEALKQHQPPPIGRYDETAFREILVRPTLQLGVTTYRPHLITIEFVAQRPGEAASVFTVQIDPPEQIVFMPVPEWVIEDIWQGGVDGMYCFRSEAEGHLERFRADLFSDANARHFERKQAKRRE